MGRGFGEVWFSFVLVLWLFELVRDQLFTIFVGWWLSVFFSLMWSEVV